MSSLEEDNKIKKKENNHLEKKNEVLQEDFGDDPGK